MELNTLNPLRLEHVRKRVAAHRSGTGKRVAAAQGQRAAPGLHKWASRAAMRLQRSCPSALQLGREDAEVLLSDSSVSSQEIDLAC